MRLSKQEKAKKAIQTISKAAALNVVLSDEIKGGLTSQLETIAKDIKKHYGLKNDVMREYRAEVNMAIKIGMADIVSRREIDDAVDVIYEMCDSFNDPKRIMKHMRSARGMIYVCGLVK